MNLNINIVNDCNLRCPSCPRTCKDLPADERQMTPEFLEKILRRATSQFFVNEVELYDNTEPTMHSDLPAMIKIGNCYGKTAISTNASIKNIKWLDILQARPYRITVSISGDTQASHGRSHTGSWLETVKANMVSLSQARSMLHSKTQLQVLYHRYLYNLEEEPKARKFARSLGYVFNPLWAATLHDGQENIAECVVPPQLIQRIGRQFHNRYCMILERNLNIDIDGIVHICGCILDPIGDFLTLPIDEIKSLTRNHPACKRCLATGLSHYLCRDPHIDWFSCKIAGDRLLYRWERFKHWGFYWRERLFR